MAPIISVKNLQKTYDNGFQALKGVDLDIHEGEVLALLGPNGAGKTTLIAIICGLAFRTGGSVTVGGHDISKDFREARKLIGLVPQEMSIEIFEKVEPNSKPFRVANGEKCPSNLGCGICDLVVDR